MKSQNIFIGLVVGCLILSSSRLFASEQNSLVNNVSELLKNEDFDFALAYLNSLELLIGQNDEMSRLRLLLLSAIVSGKNAKFDQAYSYLGRAKEILNDDNYKKLNASVKSRVAQSIELVEYDLRTIEFNK